MSLPRRHGSTWPFRRCVRWPGSGGFPGSAGTRRPGPSPGRSSCRGEDPSRFAHGPAQQLVDPYFPVARHLAGLARLGQVERVGEALRRFTEERVREIHPAAALLQHGLRGLLRLQELQDLHQEIRAAHRHQLKPQTFVHPEAVGHLTGPVRVHERLRQLQLLPAYRLAVLQELRAELREQGDEEGADHQRVASRARRDHVGDQVHQGARGVEAQGVAAGPGDVLAVLAAHQVVAGVVGDHGDAVGPQIGLHGEQRVLAGPQGLVETHAVPLEERAAEQLLRAQRELDVGGEDVGALQGLPPHRRRRLAVDALDPAEDDVGAVAVGHRDHPLQGLGAEPVVGVEEEDVTPGRLAQADVARAAGAAGVVLPDHRDVEGGPLGELLQVLPGAVRRAVVDRDDLDARVADGLCLDGGQTVDQIRHRFVRPDDHGHIRLCNGHVSPSHGLFPPVPLRGDPLDGRPGERVAPALGHTQEGPGFRDHSEIRALSLRRGGQALVVASAADAAARDSWPTLRASALIARFATAVLNCSMDVGSSGPSRYCLSSTRSSASGSAAGSRTASSSSPSSAALLDRIVAARTAVFCRLNSSAPTAAESVTAYGLPLAMKSETTLEMSDTIASATLKQSYSRGSAPVTTRCSHTGKERQYASFHSPRSRAISSYFATSTTPSRLASASSPLSPPPLPTRTASRASIRASSALAAAWAAASTWKRGSAARSAAAFSISAVIFSCAAPALARTVPVKGCGL